METYTILEALEMTPILLNDLLEQIPREILKERRIAGKWSIHEHVCHMVLLQGLYNERLEEFASEVEPRFEAYVAGETEDSQNLLEVDMDDVVGKFPEARRAFTDYFRSLSESMWEKRGFLPGYRLYTPYIMIRHLLLHDYVHMYRMEELWNSRKIEGGGGPLR